VAAGVEQATKTRARETKITTEKITRFMFPPLSKLKSGSTD